jgi:hypothetical protein
MSQAKRRGNLAQPYFVTDGKDRLHIIMFRMQRTAVDHDPITFPVTVACGMDRDTTARYNGHRLVTVQFPPAMP